MELSKIRSPEDIRGLSYEECADLADDLRTKIIQTVSANGGHLASNLGMVEITLALHRVFHTPEDRIIFDVGHQAYAHKLLTGRFDAFDTLRQYGGLSGFPKKCESEYDCFETGHASTALSAAVGMARARDLQKLDYQVIAVVGDGAFTGGMCYEALNDCGHTHTPLILVLNDNGMSIAQNVGALSKHLSVLRASTVWNTAKSRVRNRLNRIPLIGNALYTFVHKGKQLLKRMLINEGFFSALGFKYLGPVDGNDLKALEKMMTRAKALHEPVVIHCMTQKGFGYMGAETHPEEFHGTPPFLIETGESSASGSEAYGSIANETLMHAAKEDPRIAVVTAAMPLGTGTEAFEKAYPSRFFDVGIAEEHAVTMCAGMAAAGMRPFFFVYSTFLQRGYDQVLHDVCSQNLPVVFMLDRAGLANEDGQTHQGLYDFAYLRHIPNMTVLAPADADELRLMIEKAIQMARPCSIRYPKNAIHLPEGNRIDSFEPGVWTTLREGADGAVLSTGTMTAAALRVASRLEAEGIRVSVINASTIKPLDENCLQRLFQSSMPIVTIEEHMLSCGFGSAVDEYRTQIGADAHILNMGVDDRFIGHGNHTSLLKETGLDDDCLFGTLYKLFHKGAVGIE